MKYEFRSAPAKYGRRPGNDNPARRRLIMILVIVGVIALAHAIVIAAVYRSSDAQKTPDAAAAPTETPPPAPPAPTFKYKQPATAANFGGAFDYSGARVGNLAEFPLTAKATSGILLSLDDRKVLWAKEQTLSVPIASMVKMMTLLLCFEQMDSGDVTLDTPVTVSAAASKIGGGQVYLAEKETFPIGELMKTVAIKSANDSAYLLGEFFSAGDMTAFIARMNRRAAELGMAGTQYVNPHGLWSTSRDVNSMGSAEGQARLAEVLLQYPKLMAWSATAHDSFRNGATELTNTNKLVRDKISGVDGMKTGYIKKSGFCITVTCLRGGRRMILVLTGMDSGKNRDQLAATLLDWAYRGAPAPSAHKSAGKPASAKKPARRTPKR